jgi:hypothetical protein
VVLERSKQFGVIQKNSKYQVSPRFRTLSEFVIEFRHYLNQKIAARFASDALILWECNHEYLIRLRIVAKIITHELGTSMRVSCWATAA